MINPKGESAIVALRLQRVILFANPSGVKKVKKSIVYNAAGGVVMDGQKVLLLIRPARDEVRLPKGHIEADEQPAEAALREIAEESGYDDLEIVADLGEQLVVFTRHGDDYRRTEHYYLMRLRSPHQIERPPRDVEQFVPIWLPLDEAKTALTFAAERAWVERAERALERGSDER